MDETTVSKNIYTASEIGRRLGVGKVAIGSIFSTVRPSCAPRENAGFRIKSTTYKEGTPGYARWSKGKWYYSHAAFILIKDYVELFPNVTAAIEKKHNTPMFDYNIMDHELKMCIIFVVGARQTIQAKIQRTINDKR